MGGSGTGARTGHLLALLVVTAAASVAAAGTPEEPDVTDPRGDIEITAIGFVNIAVPEIDILAAWVAPRADRATFGWRIADLSHQTLPEPFVAYLWYLDSTATYRWARMRVLLLDGEWSGNSFAENWSGGLVNRYFPVTIANDSVIEVTVTGFDIGLPAQWMAASSILKSHVFSPPSNLGFRDWVDHPDRLIEIPTGAQE